MRINRSGRSSVFTWVLLVGVITGFFFGKWYQIAISAETDGYEDLKLFSEAYSYLQKNYVDPIKSKETIYGAVKGMLGSLDAHSSFMSPDEYKEMQIDTKGEFAGVGLQIGIRKKQFVVVSVLEGTPAERAGLKADDVILKVDKDVLNKEMRLVDAVKKMRGPKGTHVLLTVERGKESLIFDLVRDMIQVKSVTYKVLEPGIGYIQVAQFQEQTVPTLVRALSKLREEKIDALVLDLRNNPGGLLSSAQGVSEQFLERGKRVVSVQGRDGKKNEYFSNNAHPVNDWTMAILVNEGSASASEIVSGALQDWGRGVVVGTPTFGKASVQTILPLSDGSAMRLTTARYYTPKGRSIQNKGIEPDIVVNRAGGDKPLQSVTREKNLERHLKNEMEPELDDEKGSPDPGEEDVPAVPPSPSLDPDQENPKEDLQLKKTVELLKSWRIFKGLPSSLPDSKTAEEAPVL